jgi:hypothetical protein
MSRPFLKHMSKMKSLLMVVVKLRKAAVTTSYDWEEEMVSILADKMGLFLCSDGSKIMNATLLVKTYLLPSTSQDNVG